MEPKLAKPSSSTAAGNDKLKVGLFKKMLTLMESSQHAGGFAKIIRDLKKIYYRQTDPNQYREYRKYFFSLLWQAMIVPFKEVSCPAQERMIKCYTKFVLNTGTENDTFRSREDDFPPFYTLCIRAYKEYHSDSRSLVRLRLIQLVHEILKVKHEEEFFSRENINTSLKGILLQRSKDVNSNVRSISFKCLAFLVDGSETDILKALKYHSEFDPSTIARKSAFMALSSSKFSLKPSFLVKKAFDKDEAIRMVAFKALVNIPFSHLKAEQRLKIIQWGLIQPSVSIRSILVDNLIPAWIVDETYGNDIIKFFTHIDIARNLQTAHLLFRAIIPDDSEEAFAKLDLTFLNDDKIVPLDSLVVEKMIYWRYICSLFKSKPYCQDKIIPDSATMIDYIQRIIVEIHNESEKAKEENRDEEYEFILCLEQILRIAELCEYEDCSRRAMETLLRQILRDPVLDEAVVIFTAVDVAHTVVDKTYFNNFMVEILQELFEIESRTVVSINQSQLLSPVPENSPIITGDPMFSKLMDERDSRNATTPNRIVAEKASVSLRNTSPSNVDPVNFNCEANDYLGTCLAKSLRRLSTPSPNKTNPNLCPSPSIPIASDHTPQREKVNLTHVTPLHKSINRTPAPAAVTIGANALYTPRSKQHEIFKLKTERGELVAHRHRLLNKISAAVKSDNLLEAQKCQNEMNAILDQERMLSNDIQRMESVEVNPPQTPEIVRDEIDFRTPICTSSPQVVVHNPDRSVNRSRRNADSLFLNISEDSIGFEENLFESRLIEPNLSDSLRGIVMLTRFLTWQDKISPYVKMMYSDHIFDCLEKEDYRIRMFTMYLICIVGIIDKTEARKSLAVLIQGVSQEEDEQVVIAAFKCLVDLLLQHDYPLFLIRDDINDLSDDLPYPLNDVNTSPKELQCELLKHLTSFPHFGVDEQKSNTISIKVLGIIKLLLRGRINDEATICWLFELWLDEKYAASPISYNISYWLPLYVTMSSDCALKTATAFLNSIKNIFTNLEPENEDMKEKISKLANFVVPHFGYHKESLEDGLTVSEHVIIMFLTEINRDAVASYAIPVLQTTKLLEIQTKEGASKIGMYVKRIIHSTSALGKTQLKGYLNTYLKQLLKTFGPFSDEDTSSDSEYAGDDYVQSDAEENESGSSVTEAKNDVAQTSQQVAVSESHLLQSKNNPFQRTMFNNGSELLGNTRNHVL